MPKHGSMSLHKKLPQFACYYIISLFFGMNNLVFLMKRAILIILDSVGIGAAPDAADYGDAGANTLVHTAEAVGGLRLNCLQKMGLGNIPALITPGLFIKGVPPAGNPIASYGAMQEVSKGKDTTIGHWEMAGLELAEGFRLFPKENPSFPPELITAFETETGRKRRLLMSLAAADGKWRVDRLHQRRFGISNRGA
jgi:phosphopentomutase